jgi:predicted ArsR family transcriptional regulator
MVMHNRGTDTIPISELAQALNTTTRNANRIMLNLIQGGFATTVFTQASHSRGRPVQVYSINLRISM